jgi:hypothetical protein
MRRAIFALAGLTMIFSAKPGLSAEVVPLEVSAGVGPIYLADACWPLPPYYPRGWEIVINTPCPPGFYLPRLHAYYPYRARYASAIVHHRVAYGPAHRRPYLRPGWWW